MDTGFLQIFLDAGRKFTLDTPLASPIKRMANSYTVPSIEGLRKFKRTKPPTAGKPAWGYGFHTKPHEPPRKSASPPGNSA